MAHWIHSTNDSGSLTALAKTDAEKNFWINFKKISSSNWYEITTDQFNKIHSGQTYLTSISNNQPVFQVNSFADFSYTKEQVDNFLTETKQSYESFLNNNVPEHPCRSDVQTAINAINAFDSSTITYPTANKYITAILEDAGLNLVSPFRL